MAENLPSAQKSYAPGRVQCRGASAVTPTLNTTWSIAKKSEPPPETTGSGSEKGGE